MNRGGRYRLEDWLLGTLLGLPDPVREYRFANGRRFRFDFAWPDRFVAVEVDGGVWQPGGGRHNRGAGLERDARKYSLAAALGWRVLRVTEAMIRTGEAARLIRAAVGSSGPRSSDRPALDPEDRVVVILVRAVDPEAAGRMAEELLGDRVARRAAWRRRRREASER